MASDGRTGGGGIPGLTLQRVIIVTALFIVIYSGFTIAGNAARSYALSRQTQQLEQRIARDRQEYHTLDAVRRYMQSDEFIEAQARQEGLEKPGDRTIVVTAPTATPSSEQVAFPWWEHYFTP